jgi:hypothetical protein
MDGRGKAEPPDPEPDDRRERPVAARAAGRTTAASGDSRSVPSVVSPHDQVENGARPDDRSGGLRPPDTAQQATETALGERSRVLENCGRAKPLESIGGPRAALTRMVRPFGPGPASIRKYPPPRMGQAGHRGTVDAHSTTFRYPNRLESDQRRSRDGTEDQVTHWPARRSADHGDHGAFHLAPARRWHLVGGAASAAEAGSDSISMMTSKPVAGSDAGGNARRPLIREAVWRLLQMKGYDPPMRRPTF